MKNVNVQNLSTLRQLSTDFSIHGDDFMFAHLVADSADVHFDLEEVRRFDGFIVFLCVRGRLEFQVNLEKFDIGPNSMLFLLPQSPFRLTPLQTPCEMHIISVSSQFTRDINIDMNVLDTEFLTRQSRAMTLTPEQRDLLVSYFRLFHHNASNPHRYSNHIARSLVAAAAYQLTMFREALADNVEPNESAHRSNRKMTYVQEFLHLVREHHCHERGLAFYADQLFISPKYLSIIVKEATGVTASQWVDRFVLQEAKNLLRFSGKNIQQVAYDLNFPTQSSFGKFFKSQTGISPSAFLNS